jgi:hypothetical protein
VNIGAGKKIRGDLLIKIKPYNINCALKNAVFFHTQTSFLNFFEVKSRPIQQ